MTRPRPEPGVAYAGGPETFWRHSHGEAVRSLASYLGTTETRAAALLDSGEATAEIRSRHADPLVARRLLERKFRGP